MIIGASSLLTAVAALAAVLALIWLAGRLARFGGYRARRPAMVVCWRCRTCWRSTRAAGCTWSCGERRVLLLTGGAQDVVVGWLDPTDRAGMKRAHAAAHGCACLPAAAAARRTRSR